MPPLTPGTNKKLTEVLKASFASWEKEVQYRNITKGKLWWWWWGMKKVKGSELNLYVNLIWSHICRRNIILTIDRREIVPRGRKKETNSFIEITALKLNKNRSLYISISIITRLMMTRPVTKSCCNIECGWRGCGEITLEIQFIITYRWNGLENVEQIKNQRSSTCAHFPFAKSSQVKSMDKSVGRRHKIKRMEYDSSIKIRANE